MLRGLTLEQYGKFSGTELPFGTVTVVCGDNEAGKSTVFDALLEVLAAPSGASREGRRLKERYGEERRVEGRFDGERLAFDTGEFLNLYAFRAGDLTIEMGERSEWMERVKARLFSGGIDPRRVSDLLARRADTHGSLKHNRALSGLAKAREEAEAHLRELRARRAEILGEEKRMAAMAGELEALRGRIGEEEAVLGELEERLGRERKVARRRRMDEGLELLDECSRLRAESDELEPFRTDRAAELDELQRELAGAGTERTVAQRSVEEGGEARERLEKECRALVERRHEVESEADTALRLSERVASFLAHPPMRVLHRWRPALVAAGCLALAAGVAAGVVVEGTIVRVAGPALGAVLLAGLAIAARKTEHVPDVSARERLLRTVLDEWRSAHGEQSVVERGTLEGLQTFLIEKRNAWKELRDDIGRAEERVREAGDRVRESEKRLRELEDRLKEAGDRQKRWLEANGVGDRDQYVASVARARQNVERLAQAEARLERRVREEECADPGELRRLCDRTLRELDEQGVPGTGASEAEVTALAREIEGRRRDLDRLREELAARGAELEGRRGVMKGSLRDLPEKIVAAEERIEECRRGIEENRIEREAAALAAGLFGQLSAGADAALAELARDFAGTFAAIVDEEREVRVSGLDAGSIALTDAGGTVRALELLSSGTRECFVLAARLALARRAAEGAGILVLDEPFLTLDRRRREGALAMVRRFREERDWQMVVLTKDGELADLVTESFAGTEVVVNKL